MTASHDPTDDADLRLIADRRALRPHRDEAGVQWFAFASRPERVRIVSRSFVPAALRIGTDVRRLGIPVRRILLRTAGAVVEIGAGDEQLATGFYAAEPGQRWTNGDAVLPPALLDTVAPPFEIGIDAVPVAFPYPRRRRRALVVDATTPAPDRDAGSNVILWHMRLLQDLGFDVVFVAQDNFAFMPGYTPALHARGIATIEWPRYRDDRGAAARSRGRVRCRLPASLDRGGALPRRAAPARAGHAGAVQQCRPPLPAAVARGGAVGLAGDARAGGGGARPRDGGDRGGGRDDPVQHQRKWRCCARRCRVRCCITCRG